MDLHNNIEKLCDLPFSVEYGKYRTYCNRCRTLIQESDLRLSARDANPTYNGIRDIWSHMHCFFRHLGYGENKISETSIRGFENLKWDDQELLRERIAEVVKGMPVVSEFTGCKAEYSKTNKGKCFGCKQNFKAQEVKIGRKSSWYHHSCVLKTGLPGSVVDIKGFADLKPEDQAMLKDAYDPTAKKEAATNTCDAVEERSTPSSESAPKEEEAVCVTVEVPKKRFRFSAKDPATRTEDDHKKKMKKQTDIMWELREEFQQLKRAEMVELLKANNQTPPDDQSHMLELLVDCATFGKPSRCPKCFSGQIIFCLSSRTYSCMGYISQYTKCPYTDQNPLRSAFVIPREMYNSSAVLKNIKVNHLTKRTYMETQGVVARSEDKTSGYLGARFAKPVESYCDGRKGGEGHKQVHSKIVKHGTVVDGEFEGAARCHVYRDERKGLYTATLSMSDLVSNANSYFRMQLLKEDFKDEWYTFRSWGRVGTDIGGTATHIFRRLEDAKADFERIFMEKTDNHFEHRDFFEKQPGCFGLVDTDYSEVEAAYDAQDTVKPGSKTTLHRAVKEIMMKISDVNTIKKALNELELDVKKMPLGKLSKDQIKKAYAVLTELTNMLDSGDAPYEMVLDCTNRFYTLLPHDFGMKSPPLLNNHKIIKGKCKMLDALLDFELSVKLLNQDKGLINHRDPVDVNYEKLRCKMEYVEPTSEEFRLIDDYLKNTHGATHGFKLKIVDILRIERKGEREKFIDVGNRRLLWHGSGMGNYMGILSQGLRIAPPEAPVSGYMFGKGVYFADMVSKSAGYCRANFGLHGDSDGLLLLCDVALGNVREEYQAQNVKLAQGHHSVKGVGQWRPTEETKHTDDEGCRAIFGKAVQAQNDPARPFHLLYNEYIVYNTDQIRMRYLVRVSA